MSNDLLFKTEINYRVLYGKLFSGLLNQFGTNYVSEIEDAIQNSFLKSLKIWKQHNTPDRKENWLFLVARNDVLNQIKKRKLNNCLSVSQLGDASPYNTKIDLRLQTIIFIAVLKNISNQAKIIFVLKNIFGLSITEISNSTLIGQDAIYKSIKRTKAQMQLDYKCREVDLDAIVARQQDVAIVEDILYAVFGIGFDSFSEKTENIVNKDICLDAFALAKLLFNNYQSSTNSNLLALFCFHTARIPAKIERGKMISFFKQNRQKWNKELVNLGFHYLQKPEKINKLYLEAIIASKYMTINQFTKNDWLDIVALYEMMQQVSSSPIVKLNYCFCLTKVGKKQEALFLLSAIEKELPNEHFYFSLVKSKILKDSNPEESEYLIDSVMNKMNQQIRKEYLLENMINS